jgi:hypothetical protein
MGKDLPKLKAGLCEQIKINGVAQRERTWANPNCQNTSQKTAAATPIAAEHDHCQADRNEPVKGWGGAASLSVRLKCAYVTPIEDLT